MIKELFLLYYFLASSFFVKAQPVRFNKQKLFRTVIIFPAFFPKAIIFGKAKVSGVHGLPL
jgi:hypothetical protein